MKKGKKLNLNELKVKSFVTEFDKEKGNTIKGGDFSEGGPSWCICMSRQGVGNGWHC